MDYNNEQYFLDKLEKLKEIYAAGLNAGQSKEAEDNIHNVTREEAGAGQEQPFRFAQRPPVPRPPRPQTPQGVAPRPLPPVFRPPVPRRPRPIFPIIPIPIPIRRPQRGAQLAKEIYLQIMSLIVTYEELARLDRGGQPAITRMINQLEQLSRVALNIYASVSGSREDPFKENIYDPLPRNYCLALRVTLNRVNALYDDVLTLQRTVSDFDRQLIFMASVLQGQIRTLNALLSGCAM
jgi:hypothetical protein